MVWGARRGGGGEGWERAYTAMGRRPVFLGCKATHDGGGKPPLLGLEATPARVGKAPLLEIDTGSSMQP